MEDPIRSESHEQNYSHYNNDDDDGNDREYHRDADYVIGGCWDENVDDETNMMNLMTLSASGDANGSMNKIDVCGSAGGWHGGCDDQWNCNMASANLEPEYRRCMTEMDDEHHFNQYKDDLVEKDTDTCELEIKSETDPRVWNSMLQALFDHPCSHCKGTNIDHSDRCLWICQNPACGQPWGFDDHTDLKRLLQQHYRMEPCKVCGNDDIYKFQAVPEQHDYQRMKVLCCTCQTEYGTEGYVENEGATFSESGTNRCWSTEPWKPRMCSSTSSHECEVFGNRDDNNSGRHRRHWDVVPRTARSSASGWTNNPVVHEALNHVKGHVGESVQRLMKSGTNILTRSVSNLSTSSDVQQSVIGLLKGEAHAAAPGIGLALGTAAGTLLFKSAVAGNICGMAGQNIGKLIANGITAYCGNDDKNVSCDLSK
jgi:hypothetical protein